MWDAHGRGEARLLFLRSRRWHPFAFCLRGRTPGSIVHTQHEDAVLGAENNKLNNNRPCF